MRRTVAFCSFLSSISLGPPDPILGLGQAFAKETNPKKVNLAVGVYRGDDGKPYVLECVKRAPVTYENMEYAPIDGRVKFVRHSQSIAFGEETSVLKDNRVASAQALSGTGALRVGASFLNRFAPGVSVSLPVPTWGNHQNIFRDAGVPLKTYRYYDKATNGVDFSGMSADIAALPEGSVVLLHACAHNPTGCDLSREQWVQLHDIMKSRKLVPFFDAAYLGFASGSLQSDRYAIECFSDFDAMIVCMSMAKNFGLYGHRVGAVHIVCRDSKERENVSSQLKILIRPMYSNPPIHGAIIVENIMDSPELTALWQQELKNMANRMNGVRKRLVDGLKECGSQRDWSHITKQIGMMAFTGLSADQVNALREKHSVYMTVDGRAAITGLTSNNVDYVAHAIHDVTK